jgi:hypothetical protein
MNNILKNIVIFFFIICVVDNLYANGGPIDISQLYKTHNIQLISNANLVINSEDLFIKIQGKYSIVTVTYKIKNLGVKQIIKYGFAVDFYEDHENIDSETNDYEFIKSFAFYNNDKIILDTACVYEKNIEKINSTDNYYKLYNPISVSRKWFIADLNFNENEVKTLKVEYKISNQHVDIIHGFAFIPNFSERIFTYYFLPSSKLGSGIIKDFTIEIDISELLANKSKYTISGISLFVQNGNILTFHKTNFDLKKQKRLIINYDNSDLLLSNFIDKHLIPNSEIVSINCSNKSNPYNTIDNNPLTVWKGNKNDWIEFTFKVDTLNSKFSDYGICAIQILNGDYSNQQAFKNCTKIKKIKIYINDTVVYFPINGEYGDSVILDKPQYYSFGDAYLKGYSQTIAEGLSLFGYYSEIFGKSKKNNYTKKVIKKLKIQIQDLYRGNKEDNEFVIPEIYFVGQEKINDKR